LLLTRQSTVSRTVNDRQKDNMKELNLCLHCGGNLATLEQVRQVKTPEPEGIWHPIPHGVLYDQVVNATVAMN
jgi:hypothetical protein